MSRVNTLNPDALKEVFAYDPETGILSWRKPWGKRPLGARAGTQRPDGYWVVNYKSEMFFVHRVAYAIHHGDITLGHIDHINGDRQDNRLENLREVTRSENQFNKAMCSNNTSGFRGVNWHKNSKSWVVRVCTKGKTKILGYFKDLELAGLVADEARNLYHGKYAKQF